MSSEFTIRYQVEVGRKTRPIGLLSAAAALVGCAYFYYLDVNYLYLEETLPWRLTGFLAALVFVAYSWRPEPDFRWVVRLHTFTLFAILLMMSGIGYQVFSNVEASPEQQFAVTVGTMSVWFVISIVAQGARRTLVYLGGGVLLLSCGLFLFTAEEAGEIMGLVGSIFMMGLFAIFSMYLQDRFDRERARSLYELEQSRDKIAKQAQDLRIMNDNLLAFTQAMSHDLQGPLRRVQSFLDLFEKRSSKTLPDSSREYLDFARANLVQGQKVVHDLLFYASISGEKISKEWLDVHPICKELIDRHLGDNGRLSKWRIDCELETPVLADRQLFHRLFENLLTNALKFSAAEGTPHVTIGSRVEREEHIFYVRDNGVGFENDFADHLGQPFKRLHGAEYAGTGMGLSVVRQIVELHDGRFWAEGEAGQGAAFYCAFPSLEKGAAGLTG